MKFITQALKDRLIQLGIANKLPKNVEDFDDRLLTPALVGVSYTVTMLTTVTDKDGGKSFTKKYYLLLERAYDALEHLRQVRIALYELGLEVEQQGSYIFKVSTSKGFTLYSISPTQEQDTNILNNQN